VLCPPIRTTPVPSGVGTIAAPYVALGRSGPANTPMPSSSALIPMSIRTSQCLFSHSFTTYK
jgi:hypothetical protein